MVKRYLVLGSCRVVNTIAYGVGDKIILNKKDLWFTHYIQEHIQKIKHLFGHSSIPSEHKELFVRYEQQNHYGAHSTLRVGDSVNSGTVGLNNSCHFGTLNVVVELPTIRYIKVPVEGRILWGHMTNLDLIRNSPFNHVGGYSTDEEFLELLNEFEQVVIDSILSSAVGEAVNFIYVPHNPFIELKEGGWGISDQRVHISDLIRCHCAKNVRVTRIPVTRCMLYIRNMIEENGGVESMLKDQNHYSLQGRKVAFKYLDALAQ
ncbi:hypothetical protein SYK_28250 [Pseudodesulfovibrio nedwellii]|uniref:Uncharacterized protein n=1 Tax=Pseudodesulfovibrio nedwellii TaxID=2973072 RepID=A0ABM8B3S6_9BACT|nr:hypothetical protein [Pseudodesulfovibrio nedwellii]BDQ38465.1 hypothetical protein SYK_28250 [Pseudodesulfovibrio nedwellii]